MNSIYQQTAQIVISAFMAIYAMKLVMKDAIHRYQIADKKTAIAKFVSFPIMEKNAKTKHQYLDVLLIIKQQGSA
jgi:hypothetical protein